VAGHPGQFYGLYQRVSPGRRSRSWSRRSAPLRWHPVPL